MIQFVFYSRHIKETAQHARITLARGMLCKIKSSLVQVINLHTTCSDQNVFLNTRALKHIYDRHIYDKSSPWVFEIILNNLTQIIKRPDEVRRNMESKRGDFLFVKKIGRQIFYVSIEVVIGGNLEVVSASATSDNYLRKFTLLWSWESANFPS